MLLPGLHMTLAMRGGGCADVCSEQDAMEVEVKPGCADTQAAAPAPAGVDGPIKATATGTRGAGRGGRGNQGGLVRPGVVFRFQRQGAGQESEWFESLEVLSGGQRTLVGWLGGVCEGERSLLCCVAHSCGRAGCRPCL